MNDCARDRVPRGRSRQREPRSGRFGGLKLLEYDWDLMPASGPFCINSLIPLTPLAVAAVLAFQLGCATPVSVTTRHNDNLRTGANLQEKLLTVSSVKCRFGKLFGRSVLGATYAQPLVLAGVQTKTRAAESCVCCHDAQPGLRIRRRRSQPDGSCLDGQVRSIRPAAGPRGR
jgi:hypothetical protein